MTKAVLFDMDGVLIDSINAWFVMFNDTMDHFEHKKVSREEFDSNIWAHDFNEIVAKYFSVSGDDVREYFDSLSSKFMDNIIAFEGTRKALEEMKNKGLKIAVLTNSHQHIALEMLSKTGLDGLFDYVIGADKVSNGKPEPDMIFKALEELKLEKDDAIFVGDSEIDMLAAEKAGMRFIGMKFDGNKTDKRIENISELLVI